jgi:hypothetical protein
VTILKVFSDKRGTLGSVEFTDLTFTPKRFYWISMTQNEIRGKHAHRNLEQFIFIQEGIVEFKTISGGSEKSEIFNQGQHLYLGPSVWREFRCLSKFAVLGCLASESFLESDYIRDFNEYLELTNEIF